MGKVIRGIFKDIPQKKTSVAAIIAAAGKGERMGLSFNKIFLSIEDKPVISYTLDVFENCSLVDEIIIAAAENDIPMLNDIISDFEYKKVKTIVRGGSTRQESIQNALSALSDNIETVAIHDGARPLLSANVLSDTIVAAFSSGAAATGVMAKDTLKTIKNGEIVGTVDRAETATIQTPQVFSRTLLEEGYKYALEKGLNVTDDCALIESMGKKVTFVNGSSLNIKLTTPEDYLLISSYLTLKEF